MQNMLAKNFNYKNLISNVLLGITLIISMALTSCNLGSTAASNNTNTANSNSDPINYGELTTNISSVNLIPESSITLTISITGSTDNIPTEPISISSSTPNIASVTAAPCNLSGTYPNNSCSVTITAHSLGNTIINIIPQNNQHYTAKQVNINVQYTYIAYVSFLFNGIYVYEVNTDTGGWTLLGITSIIPVFQSVVTPSGNYLYAGFNDNLISMYSLNASSSLLNPLSPNTISSGNGSYFLAIDPYGRYLYAANNADNTISMYKIENNGILNSLSPESVVASSQSPSNITVDPSGRYVYVLSRTDSSANIYSIESDSGLLTPISPESTISLGYIPGDITIHQSGKYAYITELASPGNVHMYDLESDNGMLNPMQPESVISSGSNPAAIIIDHSGQYAYTANNSDNSISMYSINSTNGSLSSLGIEGSAPNSVSVLALDPLDKHLYAASGGTDTMAVYSVESGILTHIDVNMDILGYFFRSISIIRRAN